MWFAKDRLVSSPYPYNKSLKLKQAGAELYQAQHSLSLELDMH